MSLFIKNDYRRIIWVEPTFYERTLRIYSDSLIIFQVILSEVSPAWSRYELPKLGIAGSNPALRIFSFRG
jgi:hypothetical protein